MTDILERIVEARKVDIAADKSERPLSSLQRVSRKPLAAFMPQSPSRPEPESSQGLRPTLRPLVIAECKRASPSRGMMKADYDPAALATAYAKGGAGMVSVITEPRFFLGSASHLEAVREAVSLPILRKDFIVDPYQIEEAWAIGADAILLIAAILDSGALRELADCAHERSLSVLVEIHGEDEIEKAVACGPDAIGVNMRNLRDFSVDGTRARDLLVRTEFARAGFARAKPGTLPKDIVAVAESGLKTAEDAVNLYRQGFGAFLIGEAFVTAAEPEREVRSFVDALTEAGRDMRVRASSRGEEA